MKKYPYRFIYIFALVSALVLLPQYVSAQVNQSELGDLEPVEFINYEGPHSRIETRAQIRGIGYDLGIAVKAGRERPGSLGRYFVIHSVSDPDGRKLDADIFGLGPDVGVDHIRNLRFIIQGYLEGAYDYSERDAALLAEYITVYNAVYRGDISYFNSRYKTPVMRNITQEKAGLAIRFDEWPGQTLMLIPLGTGLGGPLSSVDTATIVDSRVTEQLRQEPDMGVEQRREMVEFLEREAEQAAEEAAVIREEIREEEQRITGEREEAREQIQEAREEIRQAQEEQRQIAQERQQPGADQQALDRREQVAQQQEREAQRQEEQAVQQLEELAKQEEALEEKKEEAEQLEAFEEERMDLAQEQRLEIAVDQQEMIDLGPAVLPEGVLGVSIISGNLGRVVKVNPNNGSEMYRSPLSTVNVRSVTIIGNRIFAIAGEDRGAGAIRLVEISASDTLEMQKQGDDDIAEGSLLWVNGQDLYAIVRTGGNLNLARFNTDLVLQMRSSTNVHPNASVLFIGNQIATQRADGSAVLLGSRDLAESR